MPVAPAYPYKQDVCTKCGWKSKVVEQKSDLIFAIVRTCPECGTSTKRCNASLLDGAVERLESLLRWSKK